MKILITDRGGSLAPSLARRLADHDTRVVDWDLSDDDAFVAKLLEAAPDVVIHAAEMSGFAACEAARDEAFRINEDGSRTVALACKICGARLFMISTEAVFSGEPPRAPWAWGEGDIPRPRTVYGISKYAGEQMVQMIHADESVVLRTGWLYGTDEEDVLERLIREGADGSSGPLRLPNDRLGNPTSVQTLVDVIRFLLAHRDVSGVVHASCEDQCTWCDFANELKHQLGERFPRAIEPCATEEDPEAALQPRQVALKKSVLNVLGYRTPNWRQALTAALEEREG